MPEPLFKRGTIRVTTWSGSWGGGGISGVGLCQWSGVGECGLSHEEARRSITCHGLFMLPLQIERFLGELFLSIKFLMFTSFFLKHTYIAPTIKLKASLLVKINGSIQHRRQSVSLTVRNVNMWALKKGTRQPRSKMLKPVMIEWVGVRT